MSTSPREGKDPTEPDDPGAITDDLLPEDLRPTDDNPLAQVPDEEREEPQLREPGDAGDVAP
jgi:hypothetical protein